MTHEIYAAFRYVSVDTNRIIHTSGGNQLSIFY
jgi:hypothetical protein